MTVELTTGEGRTARSACIEVQASLKSRVSGFPSAIGWLLSGGDANSSLGRVRGFFSVVSFFEKKKVTKKEGCWGMRLF